MLLTVRDLVMAYEGHRVLNGVSFDLAEGELKIVMGQSGCGKSTLLRCLTRLETPTSGQIIFQGEDILEPHVDVRAVRQRIGFVFQNFALYRHLTALQNITLGLRRLRRMPLAQANERARHELNRMNMLEHQNKYPGQLSGGQKQRVAIARALAMDPAVLYFDEPTSALDPLMAREVVNILRQLQRDKVSILCVTHDLYLARAAGAPVLFMDQGVIHTEDDPERLFSDHVDPRIRAFFQQEQQRHELVAK